MKVLVISDMHIGNGDKFGTFGWDADEFIAQVDQIRRLAKIDLIVLNGDIYELFKYKYEDIVASNPKLVEYLNGPQFVYIKGNHDALSPYGLDHYQIRNKKGQTIHFEHGHNADFLNGTRIGRFLCKAGFDLLKLGIRSKWVLGVYFSIVKHGDQVDRIPRKYDSFKYLQYAMHLLKSYDMVILGHTHKIEEHKTFYLNTKKKYINCGSCSLGRFQAVVLDTESLKYDCIKIGSEKKKKAEDTIKTELKLQWSA